MADINIPGVSDKYKTNDLVNSLIEVEKIPLKREQDKLDGYKIEQTNWRRVNQYMSSLRESTRTLYSFDNPFTERIATSSDENSITATADRDANLESFKVEVEKIATADRFLSKNIEKNTTVPEGTYIFSVGKKTITYRWKGGTISDFSAGLNKRGNGIIKSSIIGVSENEKAFLLESLVTGSNNKLVLSDDSLNFAISVDMVQKVKGESIPLSNKTDIILPEEKKEFNLPESIKKDKNFAIEFSLSTKTVEDVTIKQNQMPTGPILPFPGNIVFKNITINNETSDTTLPPAPPKEIKYPVSNNDSVYIKTSDGKLSLLEQIPTDETTKKYVINLADYPNASSIVFDNKNTGKELNISEINAYNVSGQLGYEPTHPVTIAQDAKIKYEGITISRTSNEIDDIIPNVTLNLHAPSEKTVNIKIDPDTQTAKDAIISFVGNYNQLMAELNIVTQTKPEIVDEIEYFSTDENKEAKERLGAFQSDFTLKSSKSSLQQMITSSYITDGLSEIKTLSQIGISSKSSSSSSISPSQMRGYMEIDEKKLDESLKNNIANIKNLFGYDSDGDKAIDTGIAVQMDKTLLAYVQTGGILAMKTSSLDKQISTTETKIKNLERQISSKESDLKRKYGNMESTLNSLESQSNSITNFSNQNKD